jgi:multisubunit Na+/H+ antiporter MnhE subunit
VKTETLDKLLSGDLGLGFFIRLVFARALKIIAVCLILTFIVWLIYMGKFTLGAFLAGAAFGLCVFFVLRHLKGYSEAQPANTTTEVTNDLEDVTDAKRVRPRTSVED